MLLREGEAPPPKCCCVLWVTDSSLEDDEPPPPSPLSASLTSETEATLVWHPLFLSAHGCWFHCLNHSLRWRSTAVTCVAKMFCLVRRSYAQVFETRVMSLLHDHVSQPPLFQTLLMCLRCLISDVYIVFPSFHSSFLLHCLFKKSGRKCVSMGPCLLLSVIKFYYQVLLAEELTVSLCSLWLA